MIEKSKSNNPLPEESQEGENVEQSPLKMRSMLSMQTDAPIRTNTKRKFV